MSEVVNQNRGCRVCGSTAGYTRVLNQLDQCLTCGFITFNEVDPAALNALYDDEYFAGAEYADYVGQQDALRRSMRNHLEQMWRYHPGRGSLLEVGCAYGLFLDEARRFFTEVAGIDICAGPIAYAKEKLRLNVECEDFQKADFGESRFDVICLWDTIEHLAEPEVYLSKAASLLNPDGMLFLTTGDISSFNARLRRASWRQIHPPTHLHYFSKITLKRLLNRFGFDVVGIETTPYYHTLYNILASIRMRRGLPGRLASLGLRLTGERLTRAIGVWINLGDIMFVAARANTNKGLSID
jgi:SAM-dependent methyltransferase